MHKSISSSIIKTFLELIALYAIKNMPEIISTKTGRRFKHNKDKYNYYKYDTDFNKRSLIKKY